VTFSSALESENHIVPSSSGDAVWFASSRAYASSQLGERCKCEGLEERLGAFTDYFFVPRSLGSR
jgi:hypothetical protein